MAYSVAQLKDMTSVPSVQTASDARILAYQSASEAILVSFDLDTTVPAYATAYDSALILLFDFIASNPAGLKQNSVGKVSLTFSDIPPAVKLILSRYMQGETGISPAVFKRQDIGLK